MQINRIQFKPKRLGVALAAVYSSLIYAEDQLNRDTPHNHQLETMVVTVAQDHVQSKSKEKLQQVAGATNFISGDELNEQRLATTEDVFKLQPGIYAKSAGNEGVKVSIRGSGINRAPGAHASGLYVLLDDIPFTGPGGTPYELLEPWWLSGVEVYRGANGFDVNVLALGGAINYLSKTGQNSDRSNLRLELGSHGYQKYAFSTAQQKDRWDYYLSVNASQYDGYQDHAAGKSKGITANVGYQINPNVETRFYLRYRETEHQTPGRLTKAQIEHDPTIANSYNLHWNAKRIQPGSTWLANKTTFKLDRDAEFVASLAYHRYPMDLQESPYRTDVTYADLTAALAYTQPYQLFDRDSTAKISLRSTTHRPDSGVVESLRFPVNGYDAGTITRKYSYRGSDNVLNIGNDLAITPKLTLQTSFSAIYTHRENEVYYPYTGEKISEYEWHFAPRLGLNYQINPDLRLYTNLSRSIEPAHPWSMIWGSNHYFPAGSGAASGRQRTPVHLDAQKAHSIEMGGEGESRIGQWQLNLYYARLKNELLSVEIAQNPPFVAESNASKTVHQGIEFGLDTPLIEIADWNVSLKQSYTLSDFYYKNDAVFGRNQLAGIPKHHYQAQLQLKSPQGYFAAVNAEYAAKVPVDYANSYYANAYTIWGLSLGYTPEQHNWTTWLEFKNLSNKHYAATVTPGYNDQGQDIARSTPGEGRSAYFGLNYRF
ncbi:TonB-dependent receptor [Acinetobacter sp. NCu2D-2]|uniref:TonB-dependent receptor family protein n=1 Tax=Acinetobacter sp. NCu2D-2 TaxID=1608473 RepID=UPI0007CDD12D|nr:TonB-dependent receptor [Acinetobacter sp. NCu2D-2]